MRMVALLPKSLRKRLRKTYYRWTRQTYRFHREKPIVFILGTGRSGSNAIVSTLNQHSQILAFHEQLRPLIRLSTEYAAAPESKALLKEVKRTWDTTYYPAKDGALIVHSDQRLWNFIPFLKEYFPNAKFVLLVREPMGCIKSFLARNIFLDNEYPKYNRHDWAKYRLSGPIAGVMDSSDWDEMQPAERASWYWGYINWYVKSDFEKYLNPEDYCVLETEQMGAWLDEFQRFVEVPQEAISVRITNKRKQKDQKSFEQLSDEAIRQAFDTIVERYPEFRGLHSGGG